MTHSFPTRRSSDLFDLAGDDRKMRAGMGGDPGGLQFRHHAARTKARSRAGIGHRHDFVVDPLHRFDEPGIGVRLQRSEEHTSELQSLMRNSYAVFCLKKKKYKTRHSYQKQT